MHNVSSRWSEAPVDVGESALEEARTAILGIVEEGIARGKLDPSALAAVAAGLVVETATENIAVKIEIMQAVAGAVDPGTPIATNTAALSLTETAAAVPPYCRPVPAEASPRRRWPAPFRRAGGPRRGRAGP